MSKFQRVCGFGWQLSARKSSAHTRFCGLFLSQFLRINSFPRIGMARLDITLRPMWFAFAWEILNIL